MNFTLFDPQAGDIGKSTYYMYLRNIMIFFSEKQPTVQQSECQEK